MDKLNKYFYNRLFEEIDDNNLKIEKHIKTIIHNSDNPDFANTNIVIDAIYENNELNYRVTLTILSGEIALSVKHKIQYESYKDEIKNLIEKYGYKLVEKTGNNFDSNKIAVRKKIALNIKKEFDNADEVEKKINEKIENEVKNIDKMANEIIKLQDEIIKIYTNFKNEIDLNNPKTYVDYLKA